MKKLKLDLDGLAVQSFATGSDARPQGTVRGNAFSDFCDSVEVCRFTDHPDCQDWDGGTGSCSGVLGTCVTCAGAGCGGGPTARCV